VPRGVHGLLHVEDLETDRARSDDQEVGPSDVHDGTRFDHVGSGRGVAIGCRGDLRGVSARVTVRRADRTTDRAEDRRRLPAEEDERDQPDQGDEAEDRESDPEVVAGPITSERHGRLSSCWPVTRSLARAGR
jgi:hypothetical protein